MTLIQTSATYIPPKRSRSLDSIGEDGELLYVGDKKSHDRIIDEDFDESNPDRAMEKVQPLTTFAILFEFSSHRQTSYAISVGISTTQQRPMQTISFNI